MNLLSNFKTEIKYIKSFNSFCLGRLFIVFELSTFFLCIKNFFCKMYSLVLFMRKNLNCYNTIKITEHVQNPTAFKIHPVKFENRLPIEGMGRGNSYSEK